VARAASTTMAWGSAVLSAPPRVNESELVITLDRR